MATPHLASSIFVRTSRSSICHSRRSFRTLPVCSARLAAPATKRTIPQLRFYSEQPQPSKIYSFQDVKNFLEKPNPNRILIDTREPAELQTTGTIPGSLNIPVKSQPDAFFITGEEFEDRFGFERPSKDLELVFYCRSGVRSKATATFAKQAGWNNVAEYPGSWLDWEANQGPKEGGGS